MWQQWYGYQLMLRTFNVRTYINACVSRTDRKRVCTLGDGKKKIPSGTEESKLRQQRAGPDAQAAELEP